MDSIVRENAAAFKLLSSIEQALLIGGNAFLVLNSSLDRFNDVSRFNFEVNDVSGERPHEEPNASPRLKFRMKCTFLLNIASEKSTGVFFGQRTGIVDRGNVLLVLILGVIKCNCGFFQCWPLSWKNCPSPVN